MFCQQAGAEVSHDCSRERAIFMRLLRTYQLFPEWSSEVPPQVKSNDWELWNLVPDPAQHVRYDQFNDIFLKNERLYAKYYEMPRSKRNPKLGEKLKRFLFEYSIQANLSFAEAMKLVDPREKALALAARNRPQMPGRFGGSKQERLLQKESDKGDLTPVDEEFKQTQLGQKIQKDLGEDVAYWSINEQKELFVKGSKDILKVRVRKEGPDRVVQSRRGADFMEPVGQDLRLDLSKPDVRGAFYQLEGQQKEDSLLGPRPGPVSPVAVPMGKDTHKHHAHDGHDH